VGLIVPLMVVVGGCSREPAAPATPDRWQPVQAEGWSFAVPGDFRRNDEQIDPRREVEFVGPDELSPGQPAQLVGISTPADEREIDVEGYIATVFGADATISRLQDFEITQEQSVEVPGATEATRLRTTYTEPALDGSPTVTQSIVVAKDGNGKIWDLRYVAVGDAFDPQIADRLPGTLSLGP
jgi:hypothetical protein